MNAAEPPRRAAPTPSQAYTNRVYGADCPLNRNESQLVLAIAWHCHGKKRTCFPSQTTLARETRMSVATIRRATQGAIDKGWLELVRRGHSEPGGARYSSEYRLPTPLTLVPVSDSDGYQIDKLTPVNTDATPASLSDKQPPQQTCEQKAPLDDYEAGPPVSDALAREQGLDRLRGIKLDLAAMLDPEKVA